MASRIKGITVEIGGDATGLDKALKGITDRISETQTKLKDVDKLLKLDPSNTELLAQKQRLLAESIDSVKVKLNALEDAAKQAHDQLARGDITQSQYDALIREIEATEQSLKSLEEQADKSHTALVKMTEIGNKLEEAGSTIEGVGNKIMPISAAVAGMGAAAVKTASDFDSAMSKVAAVSGATGDEFQALRDKAREMGSKTKFSASEAAEAMNYMAMAGWKTEDMLNGIEGIMNLAAASGEELGLTSDIVTDALTAFGLSAEDSGHFADILAAASSNANTNVSMMGETFKYAAPVLGAMGYSAEDAALAIGLMANAGIKSSQAGTALRSSITNLAKPTDTVAAAMDKYGISLTDNEGNMISLKELMEQFREKLGGLSEAEQANAAASLFGKEAMSGMLAIINGSDADFEKLSGAIDNCGGVTESMAQTMQDNLGGQFTILKSQLEELAISFGDILMPAIRDIVSRIQEFVDKLNGMDEGTRETILNVGLLVAAIGPATIAIGKVTSGVGSTLKAFSSLAQGIGSLVTKAGGLSGIFSKLGAAISGISAPVLAIVAVIAVLVAAFVNLWKNNEEFREKITAIWQTIVDKVKGFCDGIVERINALGFDFKNITEVIKKIWDEFCALLAPVFEGVFETISNILDVALDLILDIIDIFIDLFSGDWKGLWEDIKKIFTDIWDFIVKTFNTCVNTLKGVFDTICGWFGTTWEDCWNGISEFFTGIWDGIVTFFSDMISDAWNWGSDLMDNIVGGIESGIQWVTNAVTNVGNTIADFLGFSLPDKGPLADADTYMPDFMDLLSKGITDKTPKVLNSVRYLADSMKNEIGDISMTSPAIMSGRGGRGSVTNNNRTTNLGGLSVVVNGYNAQNDDALAQTVADRISGMLLEEDAVFV